MSRPVGPQHVPDQNLPEHALSAAIVSGASDAIMAVDLQGLVQLWNEGCERLFGWTAAEMTGRSARCLVPEERGEELLRVLDALRAVPEAAALETERLHKSGERLPVSCRVSPILGADGEVLGASAVVRDNSREIELRRQLDDARHLAEARFAQSVVAQVTMTPEAVILEVNAAACELSGYEPRDLLGRSVTDFMGGDDGDAALAGVSLLVSGTLASAQHPRLLRHADGRLLETRVSIFPVREGPSRPVVRLEAIVEDVSATAAAQRELQLREARWESMTRHSSDVPLFCDTDGALLFVSSSVTSVFGYDVEQVVGCNAWSFVHPEDVDRVRAIWDALVVADHDGATETFELRVLHADGTWHWAEERLTNHLGNEAVGAMVVNLVDISDRKAAEAVLDELAGTDSLTGLATRAPLLAVLDAAFAAGLGASTAVAVVDVVRMKLVNDNYGHRAGDDVLYEVAQRLRVAAGPDRMVARVGGDRFAILLQGLSDIADVFEACNSVLAAMESAFRVGSRPHRLDVKVGAALGPAVESGALVAAAEAALLSAKTDAVVPMHVVRAESASAAVSRARLVEDLRRGLAQNELVVHFQPVLSLPDGRPVAAEALVRWEHPEKGLLSPGAFIDAAEESGLIVDVGHTVLREACRGAARWARAGGEPFHVAVNLSAKQLTRGDVVEVVRQALADSGASPAALMLEVTESAVMSDIDAAVATLQELRDLGVAVAVDDFGTGYSSLTYLKRFPVTTLKIDRSFVAGLGHSADDAAIVTSVINLARAMHLDCVAEGIETEQQRLVLQALGCPLGQGFLWSPALEMDAFDRWLNTAAPGLSTPPPGWTGQRHRPPRGATGTSPKPGPDPAVVARIHGLHGRGASLHTIAAALNAENHLAPSGRRWTTRSVALVVATEEN